MVGEGMHHHHPMAILWRTLGQDRGHRLCLLQHQWSLLNRLRLVRLPRSLLPRLRAAQVSPLPNVPSHQRSANLGSSARTLSAATRTHHLSLHQKVVSFSAMTRARMVRIARTRIASRHTSALRFSRPLVSHAATLVLSRSLTFALQENNSIPKRPFSRPPSMQARPRHKPKHLAASVQPAHARDAPSSTPHGRTHNHVAGDQVAPKQPAHTSTPRVASSRLPSTAASHRQVGLSTCLRLRQVPWAPPLVITAA